MTKYQYSGENVFIYNDLTADIRNVLEPKNYLLNCSPTGQFFLTQIDRFDIPKKVYGNCVPRATRILNTFTTEGSSVGALFTGDKGSGKSLLAKYISTLAARDHNLPTIIINSAYSGDGFSKFISEIDDAVIFFDEFEKTYSNKRGDQDRLLTLLEGTYSTKKLFVLTANDKWAVNENMRNRPGRLRYFIEFSGLERAFIEEFVKDTLRNQEFADDVIKLSGMVNNFSFDMLRALVEECNKYNEKPGKFLDIFNVKPDIHTRSNQYTMFLKVDGVDAVVRNRYYNGSPIHTVDDDMSDTSIKVQWSFENLAAVVTGQDRAYEADPDDDDLEVKNPKNKTPTIFTSTFEQGDLVHIDTSIERELIEFSKQDENGRYLQLSFYRKLPKNFSYEKLF